MKSDIESWCSEFRPCQQNKVGCHTKKQLGELPYPTQHFTSVHIDIVGPLVSPDIENPSRPRYLLMMIDALSRWIEADPISNISTATIATSLLNCWTSRFDPPLTLITDK